MAGALTGEAWTARQMTEHEMTEVRTAGPIHDEQWARERMDSMVSRFLAAGIVDCELVEARPAWAWPWKILIARIREQGDDSRSYWLIDDDGLFDCIDSGVASTPRQAARHFSLKWHLEAARLRDRVKQKGSDNGSGQTVEARYLALEKSAETLSKLVNEDSLWPA
ncbi:MAG: DUF4826 family protein [Woeseiaceae bacterium]